ncbi:GPCR fungal pheromone mating factor, partial [Vararia minispora EC-137]
SIAWARTSAEIAPVFCDISSHLAVGSSVAIPACSFIITRRLFHIIHFKSVLLGGKQLLEYFLGLGLPTIVMGLYYIVQGVRFQVLEEYGCGVAAYQSGAAILILDIWPLLLPVISVSLYCCTPVNFLLSSPLYPAF